MGRTGCVILNYNDYKTTSELVNLINNYNCFDAIVIVDNCSTDDSFIELSALKQRNHIYVLQSGKNGGYGFGNNVGIRFCKDELSLDYCLIANPDVIFEEGFVNTLVKFMDQTPNCALVSGKQCGINASAWKEVGVFGDLAFNSLLLNKIFKPRYYRKSYFERPICEVYAIPGCLFLARISALYDIGLYDEEFFLFEEEKVLAKKSKSKKWKSYIITQTSYIHNHSVSINKSIRKLGQSKRLVLESNRLYLKKYCNVGQIPMCFIRVFHEICVIESILYELVRRVAK